MGTLVRSLLGVNPNVSDEIARLLELPVAERAGVKPHSLLQPSPDQVFSHLTILKTVSQHHLSMLRLKNLALSKSSRGACNCGLDCAGKKIVVLLPSSCLCTITTNMMDSLLNRRRVDKIIVTHVKAFWFAVWVKTRDVCIQTSQAFENTCALLTLKPFVTIKVMNSQNVRSQVSSLGELHTAEAASVWFLPSVSQDVCVKGLLLCESFSTFSTLVRPHACVDPLVANYLAWLAELFATELATQFESVTGHWTFPLLDQLKTGLELLVPEKVLLVGLGGVTDLVASLADESSPLWLNLVSACNCLTLSSMLVLSCLMLL